MRRGALVLVLTLTACGGSSTPDTVDPSTEAPAGGHTAASATTANSAKGVSELFVQEDPTLNVSDTAAQNAQNIQTQVQTPAPAFSSAPPPSPSPSPSPSGPRAPSQPWARCPGP